MTKYILKRLLYGLITCALLLVLVFFMTRLSGDPSTWLVRPSASEALREQILSKYGLTEPVWKQFLLYVKNIFMGDFGDSFYYKRPVMEVIFQRLPSTLELTVTGLALACLIGIPIGVYSAANKDTALDKIARGFSFFAISAPGFWIGIVLALLFSTKLQWLPSGGRTEPGALILPAITVALSLLGSIMRLTRSGMINTLDTEYVKLARAKGAPRQRVIWVHAFKNASTSVITTVMLLFANVLSGDVVVEQVFSWPGIGKMIMQAVGQRDYPLIQGFTLLVGVFFVVINIAADILYAVVDPKIRNFN